MNRIKNKSYILQYAQRFKKFINPKLKKGFNPDTVVKSSTLTGGAIADQFTKLIKLIVAERPKTTSTKYNQDL